MRFLGHREDVPALLRAADLFAMTSLSEGLPLALVEALAAERAPGEAGRARHHVGGGGHPGQWVVQR